MNYLFLIYLTTVLSFVSSQVINLPAGITLDLGLDAFVATGSTIVLPLTLAKKLIVKGDLNVNLGKLTLNNALVLDAGANVVIGSAGSLLANNGILCNNTKATIDGTVELATGKAIEVKGTGDLVLGGTSDLFAEVNADATAKVTVAGTTSVNAATALKGEGLYLLNGTIIATGDAAVSLGEAGKSKLQLAGDAVVSVADDTKASAAVTLNNVEIAAAAGANAAVSLKDGVDAKLDAGVTLAEGAVLDIDAKSKATIGAGASLVKQATVQGSTQGKATIKGAGALAIAADAVVEVEANTILDVATDNAVSLQGTVKSGAGSLFRATGLVVESGKGHIDCAFKVVDTYQAIVSPNAELVLGGIGVVSGEIEAQQDATVSFIGNSTLDAETSLIGAGKFNVDGILSTSGDAAINIGDADSNINLGLGAVIATLDAAKASADVNVKGKATVAAAAANGTAATIGAGAKVKFDNAVNFVTDAQLKVDQGATATLNAAGNTVEVGEATIVGLGQTVLAADADVKLAANATLDVATDLLIGDGSKVTCTGSGLLKTKKATVASGKAAIDTALAVDAAEKLTVAAGAELALGGAGAAANADAALDLSGEIAADADATVTLSGKRAVSAATKLNGEGKFVLDGLLQARGDAAVKLGESGKSKVELTSNAVIGAAADAGAAADIAIDGAVTVGAAATADAAVKINDGAKVTLNAGADVAKDAAIDVAADAKLTLGAGKLLVNKGKAKVSGAGALVLGAASETDVAAQSELEVTAGSTSIEAGAKVNVDADSALVVGDGACVAAAAATGADAAADIALGGGAKLKVTGAFDLDGAFCGISNKEPAGQAKTSDVEFAVGASKAATIKATSIAAKSVRNTGAGALNIVGNVTLDADVQTENDSETKCSDGETTINGSLGVLGNSKVIVDGAAAKLNVQKKVDVAAGATLDIKADAEATVESLLCGLDVDAAAKAAVALAGKLNVKAKFNLDLQRCTLGDGELCFTGEGEDSEEPQSFESGQEESTSEVKEGDCPLSKVCADNAARIITTGDVTFAGDLALDGKAEFLAQKALEFKGDVVVAGESTLQASGNAALKVKSVTFGEATKYRAVLAANAAAQADAALDCQEKATFDGELEIAAYGELKNGDVYVIAKHDSAEGQFKTVVVANATTNGRRRAVRAEDWEMDYGDKETTATYKGEDRDPVETPAPTPVGTFAPGTTITDDVPQTQTSGDDSTTTTSGDVVITSTTDGSAATPTPSDSSASSIVASFVVAIFASLMIIV